MRETFPELPVDEVMSCEVSRLAILPEYQNSVVMMEIIRMLIKRASERKVRYAFNMAPTMLARNYRKVLGLFGLTWEIRKDITIPDREEFEGIKMVYSVLDLAPAYREKTKKPQQVSFPETAAMLSA